MDALPAAFWIAAIILLLGALYALIASALRDSKPHEAEDWRALFKDSRK